MTVSWTFAAASWAIDLRWFWFQPTTESARSKWLAYEAKAWPKLHFSQHACFLLLVFFPFLYCLKILEHLRCHAFCLAQFYELLLLALIEYFAAVGSSVKHGLFQEHMRSGIFEISIKKRWSTRRLFGARCSNKPIHIFKFAPKRLGQQEPSSRLEAKF